MRPRVCCTSKLILSRIPLRAEPVPTLKSLATFVHVASRRNWKSFNVFCSRELAGPARCEILGITRDPDWVNSELPGKRRHNGQGMERVAIPTMWFGYAESNMAREQAQQIRRAYT